MIQAILLSASATTTRTRENSWSYLQQLPHLAFSRYCTFIWILVSCLLVPAQTLFAQDELVGLTSVGGQEGAGTAFSIKSNGTGFNVQKPSPYRGMRPMAT
ncbi:hypothetical protein AHMF7605_20290 [Adhaeribacter arboris]|uniref:Uncharacterized protein n=1 Tax=Adhaeribacter arboris TaxID=2072846 RepID=A0A2T2YJJ4_9BACT|nr:hypothetical protein [Adhaeribacter arboris]PSR55677.1 hypothetical protein AHMF7605_20290 [Adhaeribacter arboris]